MYENLSNSEYLEHGLKVLGSNDPNTILDPTGSDVPVLCSVLCFHSDSILFGLSYGLCFLGLGVFWLHSLVTLRYMFHVYLLSSCYFSRSFFAHFLNLFPPYSSTPLAFSMLSLFSTLLSCYQTAIWPTTLINHYDLMTIPFILFFIHTLSFDELRIW